jgi:membrane protein YqaA with SNARE-associated domain
MLSILVVIYFWDEIENARRYGYWGAFMISILGGITIVPAPSFFVIFTLGHVLDPLRIGLISGVGEAIGGITVYLTGAGGKNIWSRFYSKEQFVYDEVSSSFQRISPQPKGFRAKYQQFYSWIEKQMKRRGSIAIFASAAVIMGPYYPVGLAAGSLRIGLKKFVLLSWAGKTVKGMTIAYAGYFGLHILRNWIEWLQSLAPTPPPIGGIL